jgi:hypothetical protein
MGGAAHLVWFLLVFSGLVVGWKYFEFQLSTSQL